MQLNTIIVGVFYFLFFELMIGIMIMIVAKLKRLKKRKGKRNTSSDIANARYYTTGTLSDSELEEAKIEIEIAFKRLATKLVELLVAIGFGLLKAITTLRKLKTRRQKSRNTYKKVVSYKK